ncbi:MAG: hypothetical protein V1858_04900 [Candidatus Gottesmanbacteria bacterium]
MVKLPNTSKKTKVIDKTNQTSNNPIPQMLPPDMPVPSAAKPQGTSIGAKEKEIFAQQDETALEELRKEMELAPEVKEAGIEVKKEQVEISEPVQKMGVVPSDINQPVTPITANLPINDDKIVTATTAPVITSLRWLVEWCIRQLKKVHIRLKKVHGRIIRVVFK